MPSQGSEPQVRPSVPLLSIPARTSTTLLPGPAGVTNSAVALAQNRVMSARLSSARSSDLALDVYRPDATSPTAIGRRGHPHQNERCSELRGELVRIRRERIGLAAQGPGFHQDAPLPQLPAPGDEATVAALIAELGDMRARIIELEAENDVLRRSRSEVLNSARERSPSEREGCRTENERLARLVEEMAAELAERDRTADRLRQELAAAGEEARQQRAEQALLRRAREQEASEASSTAARLESDARAADRRAAEAEELRVRALEQLLAAERELEAERERAQDEQQRAEQAAARERALAQERLEKEMAAHEADRAAAAEERERYLGERRAISERHRAELADAAEASRRQLDEAREQRREALAAAAQERDRLLEQQRDASDRRHADLAAALEEARQHAQEAAQRAEERHAAELERAEERHAAQLQRAEERCAAERGVAEAAAAAAREEARAAERRLGEKVAELAELKADRAAERDAAVGELRSEAATLRRELEAAGRESAALRAQLAASGQSEQELHDLERRLQLGEQHAQQRLERLRRLCAEVLASAAGGAARRLCWERLREHRRAGATQRELAAAAAKAPASLREPLLVLTAAALAPLLERDSPTREALRRADDDELAAEAARAAAAVRELRGDLHAAREALIATDSPRAAPPRADPPAPAPAADADPAPAAAPPPAPVAAPEAPEAQAAQGADCGAAEPEEEAAQEAGCGAAAQEADCGAASRQLRRFSCPVIPAVASQAACSGTEQEIVVEPDPEPEPAVRAKGEAEGEPGPEGEPGDRQAAAEEGAAALLRRRVALAVDILRLLQAAAEGGDGAPGSAQVADVAKQGCREGAAADSGGVGAAACAADDAAWAALGEAAEAACGAAEAAAAGAAAAAACGEAAQPQQPAAPAQLADCGTQTDAAQLTEYGTQTDAAAPVRAAAQQTADSLTAEAGAQSDPPAPHRQQGAQAVADAAEAGAQAEPELADATAQAEPRTAERGAQWEGEAADCAAQTEPDEVEQLRAEAQRLSQELERLELRAGGSLGDGEDLDFLMLRRAVRRLRAEVAVLSGGQPEGGADAHRASAAVAYQYLAEALCVVGALRRDCAALRAEKMHTAQLIEDLQRRSAALDTRVAAVALSRARAGELRELEAAFAEADAERLHLREQLRSAHADRWEWEWKQRRSKGAILAHVCVESAGQTEEERLRSAVETATRRCTELQKECAELRAARDSLLQGDREAGAALRQLDAAREECRKAAHENSRLRREVVDLTELVERLDGTVERLRGDAVRREDWEQLRSRLWRERLRERVQGQQAAAAALAAAYGSWTDAIRVGPVTAPPGESADCPCAAVSAVPAGEQAPQRPARYLQLPAPPAGDPSGGGDRQGAGGDALGLVRICVPRGSHTQTELVVSVDDLGTPLGSARAQLPLCADGGAFPLAGARIQGWSVMLRPAEAAEDQGPLSGLQRQIAAGDFAALPPAADLERMGTGTLRALCGALGMGEGDAAAAAAQGYVAWLRRRTEGATDPPCLRAAPQGAPAAGGPRGGPAEEAREPTDPADPTALLMADAAGVAHEYAASAPERSPRAWGRRARVYAAAERAAAQAAGGVGLTNYTAAAGTPEGAAEREEGGCAQQ